MNKHKLNFCTLSRMLHVNIIFAFYIRQITGSPIFTIFKIKVVAIYAFVEVEIPTQHLCQDMLLNIIMYQTSFTWLGYTGASMNVNSKCSNIVAICCDTRVRTVSFS